MQESTPAPFFCEEIKTTIQNWVLGGPSISIIKPYSLSSQELQIIQGAKLMFKEDRLVFNIESICKQLGITNPP